MSSRQKMSLTLEHLQTLVPAKFSSEPPQHISSLTYSSNGEQMILTTSEDAIFLYDITTGMRSRSVNSKKYGCGYIQFAANGGCALHSSTKVDNTVRYLSLSDNKYLRYFQGHTEKVTGLSVSPLDDLFLSVSLDKTIRLWDLRSYQCMGIMNVQSTPLATFDPEGLLFAAAMNNSVIKLYDIRSFEKGPFLSFQMPEVPNVHWTTMRFSPCGKYILVTTNSDVVYLIDAFTGEMKHTLTGHENVDHIPLSASFSPDSQFVMCGSSKKSLVFWDTESGKVVQELPSPHELTPHIAEFNPRYLSVASAEQKLILWCPSDDISRLT